jgi:hypothetical protein
MATPLSFERKDNRSGGTRTKASDITALAAERLSCNRDVTIGVIGGFADPLILDATSDSH